MQPGHVTFGVRRSTFSGNMFNCSLNSYRKFGGAGFFSTAVKKYEEERISSPRSMRGLIIVETAERNILKQALVSELLQNEGEERSCPPPLQRDRGSLPSNSEFQKVSSVARNAYFSRTLLSVFKTDNSPPQA